MLESEEQSCGVVLVLLLAAACGLTRHVGEGPQTDRFRVYSLGKPDMNQVLEVNVREARFHLRELIIKKIIQRMATAVFLPIP